MQPKGKPTADKKFREMASLFAADAAQGKNVTKIGRDFRDLWVGVKQHSRLAIKKHHHLKLAIEQQQE